MIQKFDAGSSRRVYDIVTGYLSIPLQDQSSINAEWYSTKCLPPEEALAAFENAVKEVSAEDWRKCFQNWFRRMKLSIEAGGEFFEKI
ncbi:hypothetical protein evm_011030 [Chilo suppressalis]|nr:hypothetical protein evm_015586 [Chilo suppressalis]RVE44306.1 hypothetical protein evm_011030 [Chilo suppressalis]